MRVYSINYEKSSADKTVDYADLHCTQTDEQLVMILEKFEEAIDEQCRVLRKRIEYFDDKGITFSEFVHVYKTTISGMKALQMLPSLQQNSSGKNDLIITSDYINKEMECIISNQREKTIERSLKMIEEFTRFPLFSSAAIISASDDEIIVSGSDCNTPQNVRNTVNTTQRNINNF